MIAKVVKVIEKNSREKLYEINKKIKEINTRRACSSEEGL